MEEFPPVVDLSAEPTASGRGHLWILEEVDGLPLRFALEPDGRLVFRDRTRRLDPDAAEPALRPAIREVQSQFRRDAFRNAVEDPSKVTFYGVGTCQHRLDYDWAALPAFLGYDVHAPARDGLLTPDAAHSSFEELGLTPAPALEREVRAETISTGDDAFPDSQWADDPVAGVRLADKHGWRGRLDNPDRPTEPAAAFEDVEEAAETLVTETHRAAFEKGASVDELRDRLAREHRAELSAGGIDSGTKAFRSAVARALQPS